MAELLTEKEQLRRARNAEVAVRFKEMKRKYPSAKDGRIIKAMAKDNVAGLTSVTGIRNALIERGCLVVAQ